MKISSRTEMFTEECITFSNVLWLPVLLSGQSYGVTVTLNKITYFSGYIAGIISDSMSTKLNKK